MDKNKFQTPVKNNQLQNISQLGTNQTELDKTVQRNIQLPQMNQQNRQNNLQDTIKAGQQQYNNQNQFQQSVEFGQEENEKYQNILKGLNDQNSQMDKVLSRINNKYPVQNFKQNMYLQNINNNNIQSKNLFYQTPIQQQFNENSPLKKRQQQLKEIQYLSEQKPNQIDPEDQFWKIKQGEFIERKFRSLTKQGYMDDKTFQMVLGQKTKKQLSKVQKQRRGYSNFLVQDNVKTTPDQIMHQYLYQNVGKKTKEEQQVNSVLLDRELDLLNNPLNNDMKNKQKYQKLFNVYPQYDKSDIQENDYPDILSQNQTQFENNYKYLKYFKHNDNLNEQERFLIEKSQVQLPISQTGYPKYEDRDEERKKLYHGLYKNDKPNSTFRDQIQHIRMQQQQQQNGNEQQIIVPGAPIYKRYDGFYSKNLDSTFNEEFNKKFDPTYNKDRDIRKKFMMNDTNSKIGQFQSNYEPNYTGLNQQELQEQQQFRESQYVSNENVSPINFQKRGTRSMTQTTNNLKGNKQRSLRPIKNNNRDIVLNPHLGLQQINIDDYQQPSQKLLKKYNQTQKYRSQQQINLENQNNMINISTNNPLFNESQYYTNYERHIQMQSQETLTLLDSVFSKDKNYSQQELSQLMGAFKKKYTVLAELQNQKLNTLKKQHKHNIDFNIPEETLKSNRV